MTGIPSCTLYESFPIWPDRGMLVGYEGKLRAVGLFGRDDHEPPMLAHGEFGLLYESENLGVEAQRRHLVVNEDAGQGNPHLVSFRLA